MTVKLEYILLFVGVVSFCLPFILAVDSVESLFLTELIGGDKMALLVSGCLWVASLTSMALSLVLTARRKRRRRKKVWHFPGANQFFRREWEGRIAKLKKMSKMEILTDSDNLRDMLFLICPRENYQPHFCETLRLVLGKTNFEMQKSRSESWEVDAKSGEEQGQEVKYLGLRRDLSVVESTKEKNLAELGITSEDIGVFEVKTTWHRDDWASHPSFGYYARFQPF